MAHVVGIDATENIINLEAIKIQRDPMDVKI